MCTGFHGEIESPQHTNGGTGGVPEVNIVQLDSARDTLQRLALTRLGVDLWGGIDESNDILRGAPRLGNVRDESEYVSGLSTRGA